jgi:predicted nuclease with TOPRIM domain
MSLSSLKKDLENIQDKIRLMQDDVNALRDKKERIAQEYDRDIRAIESRLQEARRREPDLARLVKKEEEYVAKQQEAQNRK